MVEPVTTVAATLGALIALWNQIDGVINNAAKFETQLRRLKGTIEILLPEMEKLNESKKDLKGAAYRKAAKELRELLEKGMNLVQECYKFKGSKIKGFFCICQKSHYLTRLEELGKDISWFHELMRTYKENDLETKSLHMMENAPPTRSLPLYFGHPNDKIKTKSSIFSVEAKPNGYVTEIRSTKGIAVPVQQVGKGEALGTVFAELLDEFERVKDKASEFRSDMRRLSTTLQIVGPLLMEIELYNNENLTPQAQREIDNLIILMKKGTKVVYKCAKTGDLNWRKGHYHRVLEKLETQPLRFFTLHMDAPVTKGGNQIVPVGNSDISTEPTLPPHLGEPIALTLYIKASLPNPGDKITINSMSITVEFRTNTLVAEIHNMEGEAMVRCTDKFTGQVTVTPVSFCEWITKLFDQTQLYADSIHQFRRTENDRDKEAIKPKFDDLQTFLWEISSKAFRFTNPTGGVRTRIYLDVVEGSISDTDNVYNSSPSLGSRNPRRQQYQRAQASVEQHSLAANSTTTSSSTFVTFVPTNDGSSSVIAINPCALPLKLNGTNYAAWRAQFVPLLIGYGLMQFIDGSASPHNVNDHHWVRQDQLLRHAIIMSIEPTLFTTIAYTTSAREAWTTLSSLYDNNASRSRVMVQQDSLQHSDTNYNLENLNTYPEHDEPDDIKEEAQVWDYLN